MYYGFENLCSPQDISHHGIKGQKWGVRRYQNPDGTLTSEGEKRYGIKNKKIYTYKTKNGEVLTYKPLNKFNRFLARNSKKYRDAVNRDYNYEIENQNGEKVGNLELELKDDGKTTYINWLSTNQRYGGKGYGRAGLEFAERFAKEHGSERITAEVVGHTPQINHLVDNMGYIRMEQILGPEDDVWGGLTRINKEIRR